MTRESIRARVAAATPGPWRSRPPSEVPPKERARYGCVFFGTSRDEPYSTSPLEKPDAQSIAHARTDIERLLAVADAAAEYVKAEADWLASGDTDQDRDTALMHKATATEGALRDALAALEATE